MPELKATVLGAYAARRLLPRPNRPGPDAGCADWRSDGGSWRVESQAQRAVQDPGQLKHAACKSAVGFDADQRHNALNILILSAPGIFAD